MAFPRQFICLPLANGLPETVILQQRKLQITALEKT